MQRVLKVEIVGKTDSPKYNFLNHDGDLATELFRKDSSTTCSFGRILHELLHDVNQNGGVLTLRYDWDI